MLEDQCFKLQAINFAPWAAWQRSSDNTESVTNFDLANHCLDWRSYHITCTCNAVSYPGGVW